MRHRIVVLGQGTVKRFDRIRPGVSVGSALLRHGMRLAREAGASRMLVGCLGAPAHPVARGLYHGVGFREFTRDVPYIKRAG